VAHRKPNVKIGIAGWSYPDWKDIVYPSGGGWNKLRFIAQFFPAIEINSTFYRIPSTRVVDGWCAEVSSAEDFTFAVKLLQDFTHGENKGDITGLDFTRNVSSFKQALQPIQKSGRLGAVLIQLPYSFHLQSKNLDYLKQLFHAFEGAPLVVEVRHRSFQNKEFFDFLRLCRVGFVNLDQPPVSYSLGPTAEITGPVAYVRFHGRNSAAWFNENATRDERYDYCYSGEELGEWIERVEQLSSGAVRVYVMFNNHFRGQEVVNALEFLHLWSEKPVPVPAPLKRVYPRLKDIASEFSPRASDADGTLPLFSEK
jgi:uncharacterized protein YecE (DUF72 family)